MTQSKRYITALLLALCPLVGQGDNTMASDLTKAIANNTIHINGWINPETIPDEVAAMAVIQHRQVIKKLQSTKETGVQVIRPLSGSQASANNNKSGGRKIVTELKRQSKAGIVDGAALGRVLNKMTVADKKSNQAAIKLYLKKLTDEEREYFLEEVAELKFSIKHGKTDWEAVGREAPEAFITSVTERVKSAEPSLWN